MPLEAFKLPVIHRVMKEAFQCVLFADCSLAEICFSPYICRRNWNQLCECWTRRAEGKDVCYFNLIRLEIKE